MPVSEKDIFTSLMQDPNHAFKPIEKVWAEAQQRARQFQNNEKALSLAFDASPALEKLFYYLENGDFLHKAIEPNTFEDKIRDNIESLNSNIAFLGKYIRAYNNAEGYTQRENAESDMHPNEGWNALINSGQDETEDMVAPEGITLRRWSITPQGGHNFSRGTPGNIFDTGNNLTEAYDQLRRVQKIIANNQSIPEGLAAYAEAQEIEFPSSEGRNTYIAGMTNQLKSLFETQDSPGIRAGELKSEISDYIASWITHPLIAGHYLPNGDIVQGYHKDVVEARGGNEGTDPEVNIPPTPEAASEPSPSALPSAAVVDEASSANEEGEEPDLRTRLDGLSPEQETEFTANLAMLTNLSIEEILGGDRDLARNMMFHALDMLGSSAEEKADAASAWHDFNDSPQGAVEGPDDNGGTPEAQDDTADPTFSDPAGAEARVEESAFPPEGFQSDADLNDYAALMPKRLNGEEVETLYPRVDENYNTELEGFNPWAEIESASPDEQMDKLDAAEKKLLVAYMRIHGHWDDFDQPEGTPHLGFLDVDPYFPMNEIRTDRTKWNINKDSEDFDSQKHLEYNELNRNKALIEEHLRLLWSAKAGYGEPMPDGRVLPAKAPYSFESDVEAQTGRTIPWIDSFGEALSRIWPDRQQRPLFHIPHGGGFQWYQLLENFANMRDSLGGGEGAGPEWEDEQGNVAFNQIPSHFMEKGGYAPWADNLRFTLNKGLKQIANIIGDATSEEQTYHEQQALSPEEGGISATEGQVSVDRATKLFIENHIKQNKLGIGGRYGVVHPAWEEWEADMTSNFTKAWETYKNEKGIGEREGGTTRRISPEDYGKFLDWVGIGEGAEEGSVVTDMYGPRYQQIPALVAGAEQAVPESQAETSTVPPAETSTVPPAETPAETPAVPPARPPAVPPISNLSETELRDWLLEVDKKKGEGTPGELEDINTYLQDLPLSELVRLRNNEMQLRTKQRQEAYTKRQQETEKESPKIVRTQEALKELQGKFKKVYNATHGIDLNDDALTHWSSQGDSIDKQYEALEKEYAKAIKALNSKKEKGAAAEKKIQANNISGRGGITALAELPNVTEDDLKFQVRRLINWQEKHKSDMDKKSLETWDGLWAEATQFGNNQGIDLEDIVREDEATNKPSGNTFGGDEWFEAVGEQHKEEQKTKNAYRKAVATGGQLRNNINYKSWLAIEYDDDGTGHFIDLRRQNLDGQWGARLETPKHMLEFDDDNHWHHNAEKPETLGLASDEFWDKLDYANLRPKDAQGFPEKPQGWYHPESSSWINKDAYQQTRNDLINAGPGSGVVITDPTKEEFATYSGKKQENMGTKHATYYVDYDGHIHHVDSTFDGAKYGDKGLLQTEDLSKPKNTNNLVHAWHSQQLQNQLENNQAQFMDETGQPKSKAIISPPGVQPPPQPIQNAVKPTDALMRRRKQGLKPQQMGNLASDELGLGEGNWWTRAQEWKQKIKSVEDNPLGPLTGAIFPVSVFTRLLMAPLGGWSAKDNVIRRVRRNYQRAAKIANETQSRMQGLTYNGEPMSYLSDGEATARKEDHNFLKRHLSAKQKEFATQEKQHNLDKNTAEAAKAARTKLEYQTSGQAVQNLNPLVQSHWDKINASHDTEFGNQQVQQAMAPPQGEAYPNIAEVMSPIQHTQTEKPDTYQSLLD